MVIPYPPYPQPTCPKCRLQVVGSSGSCISCLATHGPVPPPGTYLAVPSAAQVSNPIYPPAPQSTIGLNNMCSLHEQTYMHKMYNALSEMDRESNFVPDGLFLDLGCCPGGFTTYVLNKWPRAYGVGVSLPVEFGGHSLAVPQALLNRLEIVWADVTMFNLAPVLLYGYWNTSIFAPCPIPFLAFDFVMVDGHQPPGMISNDPRASWSRDRLLLSQLIVALRSVKPAGILLVKFSLQVSVPLMERVILALSDLSPLPVRAMKQTNIYATASTFYILAQALDTLKCFHLVKILQGLWYFMTFGGPHGFGRALNENDMDQIATYPNVLAARPKLISLFAPIEEIRNAARAGVLQVPS